MFIDQGHRLSLEVNMNYIFQLSVDDGEQIFTQLPEAFAHRQFVKNFRMIY